MPELISRHRTFALLATVIGAQVLLLAFQVWHGHNVRLARYWAVQIMSPVESAGTWSLSKVRGVWTGYVDLHGARKENRELRARLDELELRDRALETRASEADRLEALLDFRNGHREAPMVAAQVIGASADPSSHTIFINRGEHDHVRLEDPVITPDGIAGKIVQVQPTTSEVRLINDKESGVGALLLDTRTHGVVDGNGDSAPRMDYVVNGERVHPGEEIVTSGEDRIFPKGLLVGTVGSSKAGSPFQTITVQPGARLDRLEDVIVLLSREELTAKKSGEWSATSGVVVGLPPLEDRATAKPEASSERRHEGPSAGKAENGRAAAPAAAAKVQAKPAHATPSGATPPRVTPAPATPPQPTSAKPQVAPAGHAASGTPPVPNAAAKSPDSASKPATPESQPPAAQTVHR